MSNQKRARDENTPSNIDGAASFWPFKRFRPTETDSPAQKAKGFVSWEAVLPLSEHNTSEAGSKPIPVESNCSSSFSIWQQANAMRYNAKLVAAGTDSEEGGGATHVAPVDLAEHSQYFATAFNNKETFQIDLDGLQCLPVNIRTSQACLHTVVSALYSRHIQLTPATVEETLRTARFLGMPTVVLACTAFITKHMAKQAPLEVARLGTELHLEVLIETAESAIISGNWSGPNLQRLIRLLKGRSPKDIRAMLHRPSRANISELEVVEVLRASPDQPPDLATAIDFSMMQQHELQALARHIAALPVRQMTTQFWSCVCQQVVARLVHHHKGAGNSKVVLWELEADLFRKPQSPSASSAELTSPSVRVGGLKYHMVLKLGDDAGLYAKPEQGRKMAEGGGKPRITLFSLPQVVGRTLASTTACLGDVPDKLPESKGFGISLATLKTCILAVMSDLVYVSTSGKECVVLAMHIRLTDKQHP